MSSLEGAPNAGGVVEDPPFLTNKSL